ncbi:MAG: TolC family protein [Ignavibacteriaceae bacterium]|nr:TolC family protein [Ignavibacteriaceae bacterium]
MMINTPMNIKISLILLLLILPMNVKAQSNETPIVLTLDKAIDIALNKNYDIQLAQYDKLEADAQITEAYAGAYPDIKFNGQYTRNLKPQVLFLPPNTPFNPGPTTQTLSLGADNSYNIGASLSQTIYDPRLGTAITIAKKYNQYSELNSESTEDYVRADVKNAFYGVLLSRKLVDVNEQSYEVAKANYKNTTLLYQQGVSSEYDLLRSQVQLANVEPALIEAKNNYELSKNNLKNLLAIDLATPILVEGNFEVDKISDALLLKSDNILSERNPMLQSLAVQKEILDENIDIEKAAYLPTLKAFGNYNWQAEDNTFKFKDYNWANTITVGLTLSYNIFDGFERKAKIEQAEIDAKRLDVQKIQAEEGLKISLLQSKLKMNEALERINAQKQSVNQAEKALSIAQNRYSNGVGTQLEILDTQNSLTQTRINYERAVYDFLIAETEWERILSVTDTNE